jgi:V-type H+-transporting ATPase subunit D
MDNVDRASVRVASAQDNVAGVKIPKFKPHVDTAQGSKMELTGLGRGGAQIAECRKSFLTSIELLIELASLQTSFITLDAAIKTTNRRVNALENVVIPKLENTISYIKVGHPYPKRTYSDFGLPCAGAYVRLAPLHAVNLTRVS